MFQHSLYCGFLILWDGDGEYIKVREEHGGAVQWLFRKPKDAAELAEYFRNSQRPRQLTAADLDE